MTQREIGRLFVLENDEIVLKDCVRVFEKLPENRQHTVSASGFEVVSATNSRDALAKLDVAAQPFDVAIFDLGVPPTGDPSEAPDNPHVGLDLLDELRRRAPLCEAIVISSSHLRKVDVLQRLLALGCVYDFLPKPWDIEVLLDRVEQAYLYVQRKRYDELLNRLRLRRAKEWFSRQVRQWTLDEMDRVITRQVCAIRGHVSEIERELFIRLLATKDEDPLSRRLGCIDAATQAMLKEAQALREVSSEAPPEFGKVNLDDVIELCCHGFYPGIVSRQLIIRKPDRGSAEPREVTTLKDDILEILNEVVLGAIDTNTPAENKTELAIEILRRESEWRVDLRDRSPTIPPDLVRDVDSAGLRNWPAPNAGSVRERVWGLSLAQRLAHDCGARLEVGSPGDSGRGNTITLYLPVIV